MKEKNYNCLPVRESGKRKYFEYALNLQIKLLCGEYADFIRAITPRIVDLLEMVLKFQCKIDINQLCRTKKEKVILKRKIVESERRVWDENKLKGTKILDILNQKYQGNYKYGDIYFVHLYTLLDEFSDNERLKSLAADLHHVEKYIRNMAAHEIVSIIQGFEKYETVIFYLYT